MLPAPHRLRTAANFQQAVRRGRRAARPTLVVHLWSIDSADPPSSTRAQHPRRVGFVVNKAVGGAVVRNRVKRRLRHACLLELADLPAGSITVVRALPRAASVSYAELAADLSAGIAKVKDLV